MLKKVQISQQRPEDKYFEPGIELVVDDSSFNSILDTLCIMQRCTPKGYTLKFEISEYKEEN